MPKAQGKRTDLVTSCDEVTTYAELGCGRMEALRWKLSAELSQPEFDSYITKTKESGRELTSSAIRRKARAIRNEKENVGDYSAGFHDIGESNIIIGDAKNMDLSVFEKYSVVIADPPWQYNAVMGRGIAEDNYSVLSIDDLLAMPIPEIVTDDAVLFLWCTWPMLQDGLRVLEAWGFTYKTGLPWVKTSRKSGKIFYGVGRWLRGASEPILIGVRGKAKPTAEMGNYIGLLSPKLEHSRKPDDLHSLAESLPGNKIELFARRSKPGWTSFGNDIKESLL